MSNKKQTAVEFSKFNVEGEVLDLIGGYLTINEFSINIQKWFNQAKELEKKQIIKALKEGINFEISKNEFKDTKLTYSNFFEQYYKETYE